MNKVWLYVMTIGLLGLRVPQISATEVETTLTQIEHYNHQSSEQVTNVSQLRDVSPSDWSFEALRNLVERYGCIVGYPSQLFLGYRPLSRYEFAAGLNACLTNMERLIAASEAIAQEDLQRMQLLMQEFEAELAALGARVDNLDGRVAFLEDHQFSTTTKLEGQVIFGLAGVAAGEGADGDKIDQVTVFGHRTRLELNTTFSGRDKLAMRLATGNFPEFAGEGTNTIFEGNLAFAQPDDNNVALEVLFYRFPATESTTIYVAATGGAADDFTPTLNFLDGDGGSGALSAFGTRNPIYFPPGDAGIAIMQEFGSWLEFTAGYLANPANEPVSGSGLFNGPYSIISQLTFTPTERLSLAFTYANNYNQSDTGTGSQLANFQFYADEVLGVGEIPTSSNSYSLGFSWEVADFLVLGGWGTYSNVTTLSTADGQIDRGRQNIWNWAVTLAMPDLGKEGSVAGLILGMEPWVTSSTINIPGRSNTDSDASFHIEGFYEYPVTDNISITPGVIWITAPNSDSDNNALVIGTIRTVFTF